MNLEKLTAISWCSQLVSQNNNVVIWFMNFNKNLSL